jgi:hypothetical protein
MLRDAGPNKAIMAQLRGRLVPVLLEHPRENDNRSSVFPQPAVFPKDRHEAEQR